MSRTEKNNNSLLSEYFILVAQRRKLATEIKSVELNIQNLNKQLREINKSITNLTSEILRKNPKKGNDD